MGIEIPPGYIWDFSHPFRRKPVLIKRPQNKVARKKKHEKRH